MRFLRGRQGVSADHVAPAVAWYYAAHNFSGSVKLALLVFGLLLWSGVHLVPAVAVAFRAKAVQRLGEGRYRMVFALLILLSIAAMVFGWRSAVPLPVYAPPAWGMHATALLVLAAFILLGASHAKTNIKRRLRHPMLTGVVVWGVAHLLANGDVRSLVLFGGMALWAAIEILAINRREGVWVRPEPVPFKADLLTAAKGVVVYAVIVFLHPYLFGVSPIPH